MCNMCVSSCRCCVLVSVVHHVVQYGQPFKWRVLLPFAFPMLLM